MSQYIQVYSASLSDEDEVEEGYFQEEENLKPKRQANYLKKNIDNIRRSSIISNRRSSCSSVSEATTTTIVHVNGNFEIQKKGKKKEQTNTESNRSLRVLIRCRPLKYNKSCIQVVNKCHLNLKLPSINLNGEENEEKIFQFDEVLGPETQQVEVFNSVSFILERFLKESLPGIIMCYGQTATGKTHTMGLLPSTMRNSLGCIPRSITN